MRPSKKLAAVAIASGIALTATAAFAYWTSGGGGNGSVSSANPDLTNVITVHQTSAMVDFYPGQPAQGLSGNFDNSSAGPVRVHSVSAALGDLPTGCVAADFTISGTALVDADIASGNGHGSWNGLHIAMNNTSDNQNSCKGNSIPIVYTAN